MVGLPLLPFVQLYYFHWLLPFFLSPFSSGLYAWVHSSWNLCTIFIRFNRIAYWEKGKIRLNRFLLLFLRTTSHWMSQHSRGLWTFSDLQLGLLHLPWNPPSNYTRCFMIYCLPRRRLVCVSISRSKILTSSQMPISFICVIYLLLSPFNLI